MSKPSLDSLRELRRTATARLGCIQNDLFPFVKEDGTFRRKPDSPYLKDDVNVTTTCSCLMALALTNSFQEFYSDKYKKKYGECFGGADKIIETLIKAPWMSSGLTANNAFTTVLVLRAFGFLEEEGLFHEDPSRLAKNWELHLGLQKTLSLAYKIRERADLASDYLWLSISEKARAHLTKLPRDGSSPQDTNLEKTLKTTLAFDLRKILESGWIYNGKIFDKASATTIEQLDLKPTGYVLAQKNHCLLVDQYPNEFAKPALISLREIAMLMATDADNFSINEYPSSSAVIYWFVDGITRAKIPLGNKQWIELATRATKLFNHERSLVLAEHDAMMDPVAMGMSACLCARLRLISYQEQFGATKDLLTILPSEVELEHSIVELFSKQTKTGIWHKYFPMFHYQDAGSNFCFTFELLEAVLHEFGGNSNKLLDNPNFLRGLQKAVSWCEENRQKCSEDGEEYTGWNSGGYIETLRKGQPESWATAVVHMFLCELTTVISRRIQFQILRKYNARLPKPHPEPLTEKEDAAISKLMDVDVCLPDGPKTASDILWFRIINKFKGQDENSLRRTPAKKNPRSVLLFGPPGTSKTKLTKAIASDLNWPLIELTPSDFVRDSLANVYLQAEEIFKDLMDLSGVVVLFDEMDALVETRAGQDHMDVVSKFLTTTMLPKLSHLHEGGRIVFFMATNFQEQFDAAIKRPGRFDLLLCMGPPRLKEKLDRLHLAYRLSSANEQTSKAGKLISEFIKDHPELPEQLELYTYGEFSSFLKRLDDDGEHIGDKIAEMGKPAFEKALSQDSNYVTLRRKDLLPLLKSYKRESLAEIMEESLTLKGLKARGIDTSIPIIRFLCDRKESKEQW